MAIVPFLTASGLGATVTAIIQAWLAKRAEKSKKKFSKKERMLRRITIGLSSSRCRKN